MIWAKIGAFFMFWAIALGAFGAHALKTRLTPESLAVWQTAVFYHALHALALLAIAGLWPQALEGAKLRLSGILFAAGIVIFSGSLYVLALTGQKWLGAVTPLGGLCFLAGWFSILFVRL